MRRTHTRPANETINRKKQTEEEEGVGRNLSLVSVDYEIREASAIL